LLETDATLGIVLALLGSIKQRIDGDLMEDEPTEKPRAVDQMLIPLSKVMVRTLVDRMVEIERPGIDGQLGEFGNVEVGGP